jgi:putative ATPase
MSNQMGLFESPKSDQNKQPLAFRLRPKSLADFKGQSKIKGRLNSLNFSDLPHIVFWGPPGCGKTTLAQILASESKLEIFPFNAVLGGVNDLRKIISRALDLKQLQGIKSIIFIDEIHRFNKAQQDALLPYLERGDFTLFGATTEYPQTTLNKAILSRVQVWPLESLQEKDLKEILLKAMERSDLYVKEEVIDYIAKYSNGDARSALNQLELLEGIKDKLENYSLEEIKKEVFTDNRSYDKNSDRHYDVISAFIKSLRGSDVDAAILWLAVMIDGGEDPEFIARRLVISASEDVGNADPRALQIATSAHYAIKTIGMPEARIILAQATTYIAQAPKSNASYLAIDKALAYVRENPTIEVPTHLRNQHPDKRNYKYAHSFPNHWVEQDYRNSPAKEEIFFETSNLGYEKLQTEYLDKVKR